MDRTDGNELAAALARARQMAAAAEDEAATQLYLEVLRLDPTNFPALNELGTLALAGGYRSAARTAYRQAVLHHPSNPIGRVNLANVLREDNDLEGAREQYEAALAADPHLPEAHQGMAWVLTELELAGAEAHFRLGYMDRALVTKLIVAARGGNIPTQLWIDDRRFTVHAVFADFYDPQRPLPPHALVVNAIGDADLCAAALANAEALLMHDASRIINRPDRVRATGRAANARRLGSLPGVIAPRIEAMSASALLGAPELVFPLLLRRPGFHTGRHFVHVAGREALGPAVQSLACEELLVIEYLDARGADGRARKYRVMFIDGVAYPLHLAISGDWKVHYFSADMATSAALRAEERRFLEDMPGVLGGRAMSALGGVCAALGLDYAGIDFALAADGSVLLFEANATMVVFPPGADPIWDYRRGAIETVLEAARRLLGPENQPGRT